MLTPWESRSKEVGESPVAFRWLSFKRSPKELCAWDSRKSNNQRGIWVRNNGETCIQIPVWPLSLMGQLWASHPLSAGTYLTGLLCGREVACKQPWAQSGIHMQWMGDGSANVRRLHMRMFSVYTQRCSCPGSVLFASYKYGFQICACVVKGPYSNRQSTSFASKQNLAGKVLKWTMMWKGLTGAPGKLQPIAGASAHVNEPNSLLRFSLGWILFLVYSSVFCSAFYSRLNFRWGNFSKTNWLKRIYPAS